MTRATVLLLCLAVAGCAEKGGSADAENPGNATAEVPAVDAPAQSASESCTEGTWEMVENGKTKSFTFRSDKTGEEVESPPEANPLTWSMKDDKTVHIVYTAHGDVQSTEWDLNVDCANKQLSFYGAKYSKK